MIALWVLTRLHRSEMKYLKIPKSLARPFSVLEKGKHDVEPMKGQISNIVYGMHQSAWD